MTKYRKYVLRILIINLLSLLLLFPNSSQQGSRAYALTVEEERILGERFLREVTRHFEFVEDYFVSAYINKLGRYLIEPLETKPFPFQFYVINDNTLNAFAAPGGHIFIFSGLIQAFESIDELASVICHEIGHVSARHLAQRIEQNKKIGWATMAGMLAGMLIGGKAANAIITGTVAAGIQTQLHYSRNDERQADQLGFKYMNKAGFDSSKMITVLKKIEQGQIFGTDRVPAYLLTHPSGPERMSNIDVLLSGYTPGSENRESATFRELFPFFQTTIRAKDKQPEAAEKQFKMELEKDPDSSLAHFGLGIVEKERSEYGPAINHFKKALMKKPESVPILRNLGEAYQLKGQYEKAVETLEKVLETDDKDKPSLLLLAQCYQSMEDFRKAIGLYERLISMEPVKDDIFYNLGLCYGRQGKLSLAHYYFGISFKRSGKREKARFHFQKAEGYLKNDPLLQARIHEAMKDL
ncbi:MAG: M48 family metalloprotease [Pseudomonadota bacterium]